MSGLIVTLFSFGIGLIGFGLFWKLQETIINVHFSQFIIDNWHYQFSELVWESLPYIVIVIGVMCLIAGGISAKSEGLINIE